MNLYHTGLSELYREFEALGDPLTGISDRIDFERIRPILSSLYENDTETIYTMLSRGTEFIDSIDALTERKMVAMRSRAVKPSQIITVEDRMNELRNVQKERRERSGTGAKINKMDAIT